MNNILLSNLDIDECATNMDICAEKAMYDNTHGSFLCTFNDGYTGSGIACSGQLSIGQGTLTYTFLIQTSMSVRLGLTGVM